MNPYYQHNGITIFHGEALQALKQMPDESVNCVVTSPPYWGLRDYDVDGQIGVEQTPQEYIARLVIVFTEVRRVLRNDGTCWINIGDTYNAQPGQRKTTDKAGPKQISDKGSIGAPSRSVEGLKPKDIIGIPWMLAFALRADGWWLRQDIIWAKPNPMPESVTDRCTKSHEYIFLLSKSAKYCYNARAIQERANGWNGSEFHDGKNLIVHPNVGKNREPRGNSRKVESIVIHGNKPGRSDGGAACNKPGQEFRNKRSVWEIAPEPSPEAHFATFPTELVKPCILAGCPVGGVVFDPFGGAMTTMLVAKDLHCKGIAIELNAEYIEIGKNRLSQGVLEFTA